MIYSCTCNLVSNALDSKFYMKCTEESPFLDSLDFRSVLKRKTGTIDNACTNLLKRLLLTEPLLSNYKDI